MKKLKLLVREFLFWVSVLLMLTIVLTIVLTLETPADLRGSGWETMIFIVIIGFFYSVVMLVLAIQSVNEELKGDKK